MRIRTKLLTFAVSVVAGLVGVFAILAYDFYGLANLPAQREAIKLKVRAALEELSQHCEGALATGETDDLKQILQVYGTDPDLVTATIRGREGKIVAKIGHAAMLAAATEGMLSGTVNELDDGLLAGATAVKSKGLRLGSVGVVYSLARLQEAQQRIIIFAIAGILASIAAVAAGFFFSGRVTRPIVNMTRLAMRIAEGDLTGEVSGLRTLGRDEVAEMGTAFARMLSTLGGLVGHIADTAAQISVTSAQILKTAREQEVGATMQSMSVEETRHTMASLISSGSKISDAADVVLRNAEMTHANNKRVAGSIIALSSHTDRIAEILEAIKDVANKSEVLALNAALEGTKAGETGVGFSLVASHMQALAESVMGSVGDIQALTNDIRDATQVTVQTTEEATKLAAETTDSARQIALIIRQQQAATEEVSATMDDVTSVAQETVLGCKSTVAVVSELRQLSEKLEVLVAEFQINPY